MMAGSAITTPAAHTSTTRPSASTVPALAECYAYDIHEAAALLATGLRYFPFTP